MSFLGLYVAALNFDGVWNRGRVLNFITTDNLLLEYIDVGGHNSVHIDNIRFLHLDFAKFPRQIIPAKLCGLVSNHFSQLQFLTSY